MWRTGNPAENCLHLLLLSTWGDQVKRSVHLDERAKLTLQQPSLPDVKGILRLTYSLVVTADVGVCVAEPRVG